MNLPDTPSADMMAKRSKPMLWLGWFAVLSLVTYFLFKYVPHYFVVTPESYGTYFWPRVSWLLPHVASGIIAIVIGPLQFWPKIRRDYLPFHRIAGRVYVLTVLIGSIAGLVMASKTESGATYAMGLGGLAIAWFTTTAMAFIAIRRKNLTQHKQWMIRSYVVTFAFVTFRLCDDGMRAMHILGDEERSKLLSWACWALPLLITEVVIQSAAIFKSRE